MFQGALRGPLIAGCLTLTAFGQNHVSYPTLPPAVETPQEVLLLFSGDTADERILLTLNNNRLDALTTAITVYTASGVATELPKIDMVASESKLIELSPILQAAGLGRNDLGWLKLNYTGTFLEMGAQLTLYPTKDGPGVDAPRSLSLDYKSADRHAVFWLPALAKAHLSLSNSSGAGISVKLRCGELVQELAIPAKTTRLRVILASDVGMFHAV